MGLEHGEGKQIDQEHRTTPKWQISTLDSAWVVCPKLPQEFKEFSSLSSVQALRTHILEHCFCYILCSLLSVYCTKYITSHIAVWFFGLLWFPSVNRIVWKEKQCQDFQEFQQGHRGVGWNISSVGCHGVECSALMVWCSGSTFATQGSEAILWFRFQLQYGNFSIFPKLQECRKIGLEEASRNHLGYPPDKICLFHNLSDRVRDY